MSNCRATYYGEEITVEFSGHLSHYEEGDEVTDIRLTKFLVFGCEIPLDVLPEGLQSYLYDLADEVEFEEDELSDQDDLEE
jgi:hypothetical protein